MDDTAPEPDRRASARRRGLKPELMTLDAIQGELGPLPGEMPSYTGINQPLRLAAPTDTLITRDQFAEAIRDLWDRAQQEFVAVGRYLIVAKGKLVHGEFMAMVAADLPFTHAIATKLMRVARAIDDGLLPQDQLPRSYATVYEVLTLSEPEREQAFAAGVIHPGALRREVADFKARLRSAEPASLDQRRAFLLAEERRLLARLDGVRRALRDLGRI
jgi:hypothetical protein